MTIQTLVNDNTGRVWRFEQWNGQLVRPQKVLDMFNRVGRTGDVAQIVYTKAPQVNVQALYYSKASTVKADVAALNNWQGTIVNVSDKDESYDRTLVLYSFCASKAIYPTQISSVITTQYDWVITCQFIFAVQPED